MKKQPTRAPEIKNTGRGIAYVTYDQLRAADLAQHENADQLVAGSQWRDRLNGLQVEVTRVYARLVVYKSPLGFAGNLKPHTFLDAFEPINH